MRVYLVSKQKIYVMPDLTGSGPIKIPENGIEVDDAIVNEVIAAEQAFFDALERFKKVVVETGVEQPVTP